MAGGHDRVPSWHRLQLQHHARLVVGRQHRLALHHLAIRCRTDPSRASTGDTPCYSTRRCSSTSTTSTPESLPRQPTTTISTPFCVGLSRTGGRCRHFTATVDRLRRSTVAQPTLHGLETAKALPWPDASSEGGQSLPQNRFDRDLETLRSSQRAKLWKSCNPLLLSPR